MKYGITDPNEIRMFLAQCAQESGWFKQTKELGGPSYWKMYEGKKGLGNTKPGDGVKYPGRGYIQVTGRYNYQKFADASGLDVMNNPDMVSNSPALSAEISAFWWKSAGKRIKDKAIAGDVAGTTKVINPGMLGLENRIKNFKHYLAKYPTAASVAAITGKSSGGSGATPAAANSSASAARPPTNTSTPSIGGASTTTSTPTTASGATGGAATTTASAQTVDANTGQMNRPQKMAAYAARNALSKSSGYCAKYVSNAMEHAGYKIGRGNANTYIEKCLVPAGFKKIPWGTAPSTGDIVNWSGVPAHKWGHVQIWTGGAWVSDFTQRTIKPWSNDGGSTPTHWRDGEHMGGSAAIPLGTNGAADARTAATPTTSNQPVTGSQPTRTPGSVPTDVSGANPGLNQTASNANLEQQRAQQAIGAAATAQLQQQQLGEMVKMNTSLSAIHSLMKEMASKYNPSASTDKADNPSPKDSQGMDNVLDKNSAPKEGPGGFNKPDRAFGRPVVDFSQ